MFSEKEMSEAIDWLFELFTPEDYEGYDEEEIGYAGGLYLPEVCIALRGNAQTVYQYTANGPQDKSFHYRGKELFGQRACLMYSDMERGVYDIATTKYDTELWLLEDMTFAIVHCVTIIFSSEDNYYSTEYRAISKIVESRDDLFFTPESLIEELEGMCVPLWESEAIIYEL